jgi:hypothetical protein
MYGLTCRFFLLLSLLFTSFASVMNAQEIKDVLKEWIRESVISPDMTPLQLLPLLINQQLQKEEALRVSPTTRLPTKYDRILIIPKPEEMTVHMQIIPTNSPPINMRQIGSTEVLIERPKHTPIIKGMHVAPKMLVVPSEDSFDPSYGKAERRRKRTDRLVKAYTNNW